MNGKQNVLAVSNVHYVLILEIWSDSVLCGAQGVGIFGRLLLTCDPKSENCDG